VSPRTWQMSAVVGVAFLILYGSTFLAVHRFDAVSYVLAAKSPDPQARFNPHHLLYVSLVRGVGRLVGLDHVVPALQALSAVAAAASLALYTAILGRLLHSANRAWAVLGAAGLGLSTSFWISAVETDAYALTLLSLVAASACYLRAAERDAVTSLRWHAAAGVVTALGTLMHQMVVLFALAYVLAVALTAGRRVAGVVAFGAPLGPIVGGAYLAVGVSQGFVRDLASLARWLTLYAHQGYWGPVGRGKLRESLYGWLYSIAGGGAGLVSTAVIGLVAIVAVIGGLWLAARSLRAIRASPPHRAMAALGLGWLAIFVPFNAWFAPFTTVHWQFVTIPLGMLAVSALDRVAGGPLVPLPRRRIVLAGLAVLCAALGTLNYVRVIRPLTVPANDVEGRLARDTLARMPAGARVVAPIGTATLRLIDGLGAGAVFVVPHQSGGDDRADAITDALRRFIEHAWREGHPVWVFASLLAPDPAGYLTEPALRRTVSHVLRAHAADPRLVTIDTTPLRGGLRAY
jgi:hypothetical protein